MFKKLRETAEGLAKTNKEVYVEMRDRCEEHERKSIACIGVSGGGMLGVLGFAVANQAFQYGGVGLMAKAGATMVGMGTVAIGGASIYAVPVIALGVSMAGIAAAGIYKLTGKEPSFDDSIASSYNPEGKHKAGFSEYVAAAKKMVMESIQGGLKKAQAIENPVVENAQYAGKILDVDEREGFVIQSLGRGQTKTHRLADFQQRPVMGEFMDISYKNGKMSVLDKGRESGVQR